MILSRTRSSHHHTSILSDDPLSFYEQRIALIKQNNSDWQVAFRLLETAVLRFQSDLRYQNSPRYIRLWIMYIFYMPSYMGYPILFGLIRKHIGDKLSIVYESIAYQQYRDKRYEDIEATLLLGIRRKARPLERLNQDLYEYQITGIIHFDINYYKLENFYDSILIDQRLLNFRDYSPNLNKKHRYSLQTLRSQMDLLHLKLQHSARADTLRDCNETDGPHRQKGEVTFEELRARIYQHRFGFSEFQNRGRNVQKKAATMKSARRVSRKKDTGHKEANGRTLTAAKANSISFSKKAGISVTEKTKKNEVVCQKSLPTTNAMNCTSEIQQPYQRGNNDDSGELGKELSIAPESPDNDIIEQRLGKNMPTIIQMKREETDTIDTLLYSRLPKEKGMHLKSSPKKEGSLVCDEDELKTPQTLPPAIDSGKTQHQDIIAERAYGHQQQSREFFDSEAVGKQAIVQLPHSADFVAKLIEKCRLSSRKTYHDFRTDDNKDATTERLKQWFPSPIMAANKINLLKKNQQQLRLIKIGERQYHVIQMIGEGGMAKVYLVQDIDSLSAYSLKIQQPPHVWEFYIGYQLQKRKLKERRAHINNNNNNSSNSQLNLLRIHDFYHYKNASFMLMDYIPFGTLLDALNLYRHSQNSMPEPVALLLVLKLLDQVAQLHKLGIVHNDLKLDNVMLLSLAMKDKDGSSKDQSSDLPKLYLIDYGQSIDVLALKRMSQHRKTTSADASNTIVVRANWPRACPKSDYPYFNEGYYPYHADYWQLAAMAHLLLFGNSMSTFKREVQQQPLHDIEKVDYEYRLQQSIKRYWHKDVWSRFFSVLLNPPIMSRDKDLFLLQDLVIDFKAAATDVDSNSISTFNHMLTNRKLR